MNHRLRALLTSVLFDVVLLNLAFALGYYVRYKLELFRPVFEGFTAPYAAYVPVQVWYTGLLLLFMYVDGVYAQGRGSSWWEALYRISNATTTATVILIAATFIIQPLVYSRLLLIEAAVITIVFLSGWRLARRQIAARLRRRGIGVARVLIVGAGEIGRAVMRTLVARPDLGYQVVGFLDDDPNRGDLGRFRALGGLDALGAVLRTERVDEVIITLPWMYQRTIIGLVRGCDALHIRARIVPDLFQFSLNQLDVEDIGGIPLIGVKEATIPQLGRYAKRLVDMGVALAVLALTAPLLLLVTALIRLDSPGAVIFKQIRVGEKGRPFWIYKFRTMRHNAEDEQAQLQALNEASGPLFKIKNDPRQTRLGKWLRRLSIDELPQFINVLKGEMSVVGPRPGLPSEVEQYEPWQRQRLEVAPGISGLWQVSGRSDLSFDEMCLLDIYYIENWSVGLDLVIILRTIPRVLFGHGAY
jgi:exopolysaccharide biosynthesis polyprenyl glycosylphosphotransferase